MHDRLKHFSKSLPDMDIIHGKPYIKGAGEISEHSMYEDGTSGLPEIKVKAAGVNASSIIRFLFFMTFAISFGGTGVGMTYALLNGYVETDLSFVGLLVFIQIFTIIGFIAFIASLIPFFKGITVSALGTVFDGEVTGYRGDTYYMNGKQSLLAMIKTQIGGSPVCMVYPTGKTKEPWETGTQVQIKQHGDYATVKKLQ